MGMVTLCTDKKSLIYGHVDTLHLQKGPHIWARVHFALAKRCAYMCMGTLCTGKNSPIFGHGDSLHWQKGLVTRPYRRCTKGSIVHMRHSGMI